MSSTSKHTVTVQAREGFHGFWSGGKHYAAGENLLELAAEDVAAIKADAALGLPIAIEAGWPAPKPKTEEELAAAKAKADAEAAELAALEAEEQAAAAAKAKGRK